MKKYLFAYTLVTTSLLVVAASTNKSDVKHIAKQFSIRQLTPETEIDGTPFNELPEEQKQALAQEYYFLHNENVYILPECLQRHFNGVSVLDLSTHKKMPPMRITQSGKICLPLNNKNLTSLHGLQRMPNHTLVQELTLFHNRLTDLSDDIRHLPRLKTLTLSLNQLTSLPTQVKHLTTLTALNVSLNKLTSAPIESLIRLRILDLSENELDLLPLEISSLTNLQILDLTKNKLTSIPACISHLINLKMLHLVYNQLTHLPPEIGNLTKLETLDIAHNRATDVPPEMSHLTKLQTLVIHGNNFTKPLEEMLSSLTALCLPNH